MKIAVIGSGISGLTCAWLLQRHHDVTVFEKDDRIGGHTATKTIEHNGDTFAIDTGFIVFNDRTYPNFIRLLDELGVTSQPTDMSFSVSCQNTALEYGGSNLNTLLAQRRNILNLPFLRMLRDILQFNREAVTDLESGQLSDSITLGEYLAKKNFGSLLSSHYLTPMGSAIWSSTLQEMQNFPLLFFVRFFKNHGLLSINDRPQWRVIKGGSATYLRRITETFNGAIKTHANIHHVQRNSDGVTLRFSDTAFIKNSSEQFDQVVFACHSDQALQLLADASATERDILGAIPYRNNRVVLHTDASILPRARKAWSAWNYHLSHTSHLSRDSSQPATLSYNMNILQGLSSDTTFVVTLNASEKIDAKRIIGEYEYAHPVFTLEGMSAQQRWAEINGVNRTWFCGAYWRNGFHEDGCASGVRVAEALGVKW